MDFVDGLLAWLKEIAPGNRTFPATEEMLKRYGLEDRPGVSEKDFQQELPVRKGIPMPEVAPKEGSTMWMPRGKQDMNGAFGPPQTMNVMMSNGRRAMVRSDGKGDFKVISWLPPQKGSMNV